MPADLDKQPFVLFETGSITRRLVEEFFTREHIEAQIVMETENVEIIKAMVRNGLGISIIPWQAAAADVRNKTAVLQPHCGTPAVPADRLALSEDEPPPADGHRGASDLRDGPPASRRRGAARSLNS